MLSGRYSVSLFLAFAPFRGWRKHVLPQMVPSPTTVINRALQSMGFIPCAAL